MIFIFFIVVFSIFCLSQLRSLFMMFVSGSGNKKAAPPVEQASYPRVLIQIPVYNEGWEVKNAALSAMMQDYPKEKLAIQIIDDSPVHYPNLARYLSEEAEKINVSFSYITRTSRKGYKSGALNYGMQFCDYELIAILDADFILSPDFVKSCIGYFIDEKMAGVQSSWMYRNQFENAVTLTQATIFESIFALEERPRSQMNLPVFFTGSSGIWRRKIISELGGWRETPFTAEDIDMSFRSYHRGYKFAFIDNHLSSCEAISSYVAFKHQQQRWARGVWQAGVHNLGNVITAKQKKISKVLEISTIIYNLSACFILLMGLLSSLYVAFNKTNDHEWHSLQILAIIVICFGPASVSIFYAISTYNRSFGLKKSWKLMGSFLLGVGLAWAMILGIWEVFLKSKKEFVVTPKGKNIGTIENSFKKWMRQSYLNVLLELLTFLYFGTMTLLSVNRYTESLILFSGLSLSGLYSFITSVRSILSKRRQHKLSL